MGRGPDPFPLDRFEPAGTRLPLRRPGAKPDVGPRRRTRTGDRKFRPPGLLGPFRTMPEGSRSKTALVQYAPRARTVLGEAGGGGRDGGGGASSARTRQGVHPERAGRTAPTALQHDDVRRGGEPDWIRRGAGDEARGGSLPIRLHFVSEDGQHRVPVDREPSVRPREAARLAVRGGSAAAPRPGADRPESRPDAGHGPPAHLSRTRRWTRQGQTAGSLADLRTRRAALLRDRRTERRCGSCRGENRPGRASLPRRRVPPQGAGMADVLPVLDRAGNGPAAAGRRW